MKNREFHLSNHDVEARLARLPPAFAGALERALVRLSGFNPDSGGSGGREGLPLFLLPFAEFGMTVEQMVGLAHKVPTGFALDHREIYFDFRLGVWIRHIEPPTIADSLDEYMDSAETPAQGLAYLSQQWQGFLRRHAAE